MNASQNQTQNRIANRNAQRRAPAGRGRGRARTRGRQQRRAAPNPPRRRNQPPPRRRAAPKPRPKRTRESMPTFTQEQLFEYSHFNPYACARGPGGAEPTWTDDYVASGEVSIVPFNSSLNLHHRIRPGIVPTTTGTEPAITETYQPLNQGSPVVMANKQGRVMINLQPHIIATEFLFGNSASSSPVVDNRARDLKPGAVIEDYVAPFNIAALNQHRPYSWTLRSGWIGDPADSGINGIYTADNAEDLADVRSPSVPLANLNKQLHRYTRDPLPKDDDTYLSGVESVIGFRFVSAKLSIKCTSNQFKTEGNVIGVSNSGRASQTAQLYEDDFDNVMADKVGTKRLDIPLFDPDSADPAAVLDTNEIDMLRSGGAYEAVWVPTSNASRAWITNISRLTCYYLQDATVGAGHTAKGDSKVAKILNSRGTMLGNPSIPFGGLVLSGIPAEGIKIWYGITYGIEFLYRPASTCSNLLAEAKLADEFNVRMSKYSQINSSGKAGAVMAAACRVSPWMAKLDQLFRSGKPIKPSVPYRSPNLIRYGQGCTT